MTETSFPASRCLYAERRGSAFWRTGTISGRAFATKPFAFLAENRERWWENSDSVLSDVCTERTTSLAR